MDKKVIDDIVWFIPFKKLRNALRIYLSARMDTLDYLKNLDPYRLDRSRILNLIEKESMKESVEYICKNGSNARMFGSREELLKFMFEEHIKNCDYKNKLFLEFGVYEGYSINLCSSLITDAEFYGFDSFEGLPETQAGWAKNQFNLNGLLPKVNNNVNLIKGYFSDTLPDFLKGHKEKAIFIHIDCDLYSSTKSVFDNIYDRIIPGTVIQFDEYYNYPGWRNHEFKAFKEFCKKYEVEYEYIGIAHMQVAVIIKSIKN